HNLARSHSNAGEHARARESLAEAFEIAERIGYREVIAYSLETAGELAFAAGDSRRSARLLGSAEQLFDAIGVELGAGERKGYEGTLAEPEAALGPDEVAAELAAGRALDQPAAVAEALGREG